MDHFEKLSDVEKWRLARQTTNELHGHLEVAFLKIEQLEKKIEELEKKHQS